MTAFPPPPGEEGGGKGEATGGKKSCWLAPPLPSLVVTEGGGVPEPEEKADGRL